MAKEVNTRTEAQFLTNQKDWQIIDAQDLNKVWTEASDRGLPVFFEEGDEITFGTALKSVPFKTGTGNMSNIGHIAAKTQRLGWFWFPLSIFRRIPLEEEREQLFGDNNVFGQKLLMSQKDIERARACTGKTLKVTSVLRLHKPGFNKETKSPDYENPVNITCYTFNEVSK